VHARVDGSQSFLPRRDAFDVEVREADEDALVGSAAKQVVTDRVARVETGEVGRRERTIRRRLFASVHEPARCTHVRRSHSFIHSFIHFITGPPTHSVD